ncbi:MAG: hypothetical protein AAGI30_02940 [Planctomycetota bacterium]
MSRFTPSGLLAIAGALVVSSVHAQFGATCNGGGLLSDGLLTPTGSPAGDRYGESLALISNPFNDNLFGITGAPFADEGANNTGEATFFTVLPSGESPLQQLTFVELANPSPSANDFFGTSVGVIAAETNFAALIFVGAPGEDAVGNNSGAVTAFQGPSPSFSLPLPGNPEGVDDFDQYGTAIATNGGNLLAVGSAGGGPVGSGVVYIYTITDTGVVDGESGELIYDVVLTDTIFAPSTIPGDPAIDDSGFGSVLHFSPGGDWLFVGNPSQDVADVGNGSIVNAGDVYAYPSIGLGQYPESPTQSFNVAGLTTPEAAGAFGTAIGTIGEVEPYVAIGAPAENTSGQAHVYEFNANTNTFEFVETLRGETSPGVFLSGNDEFGHSVGGGDGFFFIGAPQCIDPDVTIFPFEMPVNGSGFTQALPFGTGGVNDEVGFTLAAVNDVLVSGVPGLDSDAGGVGAFSACTFVPPPPFDVTLATTLEVMEGDANFSITPTLVSDQGDTSFDWFYQPNLPGGATLPGNGIDLSTIPEFNIDSMTGELTYTPVGMGGVLPTDEGTYTLIVDDLAGTEQASIDVNVVALGTTGVTNNDAVNITDLSLVNGSVTPCTTDDFTFLVSEVLDDGNVIGFEVSVDLQANAPCITSLGGGSEVTQVTMPNGGVCSDEQFSVDEGVLAFDSSEGFFECEALAAQVTLPASGETAESASYSPLTDFDNDGVITLPANYDSFPYVVQSTGGDSCLWTTNTSLTGVLDLANSSTGIVSFPDCPGVFGVLDLDSEGQPDGPVQSIAQTPPDADGFFNFVAPPVQVLRINDGADDTLGTADDFFEPCPDVPLLASNDGDRIIASTDCPFITNVGCTDSDGDFDVDANDFLATLVGFGSQAGEPAYDSSCGLLSNLEDLQGNE